VTLTEFLTARIAEDEAEARAAARAAGYHWSPDPKPFRDGAPSIDRHQARHDPARVLAECDAKRRIVDGYWEPTLNDLDASDENTPVPLWTLKALALPYADHPDYQQEWKP